MDRNLVIAVVGILVVVLIVGAFAVFLSPQEVPSSKRLKTERLVKVANVARVDFADSPQDSSSNGGTLTGDLYACPPDGELVATQAECLIQTVPDNQTFNCNVDIVEPVCGSDGNTYQNSCFAHQVDVAAVPGVCNALAQDVDNAAGNGAGNQGAGADANGVGNGSNYSSPNSSSTNITSGNGTASGSATGGSGGSGLTTTGEGGSTGASGGSGPDNRPAVLSSVYPESAHSSTGSITLHSVEFDQAVGENDAIGTSSIEKFAVLNVTVTNRGTTSINDPLSEMKLFQSLSDSHGSTGSKRAADVMPGAFTPEALQPGETRTGLVALELDDDGNQLTFKYKEFTVKVFDYVTLANELKASGIVSGSFVSNIHTATALKINGVSYYSTPESGTVYRGVSVPSSLCVNDMAIDEGDCDIAFVNITVKNNVNLPWKQTFNLDGFRLVVNDGQTKRFLTNINDVLKTEGTALNLNEMVYGEERTGLVPFAVGQRVVTDQLSLVLTRKSTSTGIVDVDNHRGYLEIKIK